MGALHRCCNIDVAAAHGTAGLCGRMEFTQRSGMCKVGLRLKSPRRRRVDTSLLIERPASDDAVNWGRAFFGKPPRPPV